MNVFKTGKLIKEHRLMKQYTQKDLADILEVSNKAVSRWETGEGYPDVTMLKKLSKVLDISIHDLLSGEITYYKKQDDNDKLYLMKSLLLGYYFILGLTFVIGFIFNHSLISAWIALLLPAISLILILALINANQSLQIEEPEKNMYKIKRNAIKVFAAYYFIIIPYYTFGYTSYSGDIPRLAYLPYGAIFGFIGYSIMYVYFAWLYENGRFKDLREKKPLLVLFYGLLYYHLIVLKTHLTHIPLPYFYSRHFFPIILLYFMYTIYDLLKYRSIWPISMIRFVFVGFIVFVTFYKNMDSFWLFSFIVLIVFNGLFLGLLVIKLLKFKDDSMFRLAYQSLILSIYFMTFGYNPGLILAISFFAYIFIDVLIAYCDVIKHKVKLLIREINVKLSGGA